MLFFKKIYIHPCVDPRSTALYHNLIKSVGSSIVLARPGLGVHVFAILSGISGREVGVMCCFFSVNICLYLHSAVTGRVANDIQHMFLCLLLVSVASLLKNHDSFIIAH